MLKVIRDMSYKDKLRILISIAFIALSVWLDLKLPDYMMEITNEIALAENGAVEIADILIPGGKMLLCALGSMAVTIVTAFLAARTAAGTSKNLRERLFSKVESFSMEEINRFQTASLITRSTNDINQIQMVIAMGMQVIIKAPILAVWAIIKIVDKSWQWTGITVVSVTILLTMIAVIVVVAMPKFKKIQAMTDNINRIMRENLTGIRVVRAYNAEAYQTEKFDTANREITGAYLFTGRIMAIMMPVMMLIMNGLNLGVYWVGVYLIDDAALMDKVALFGDMVTYSSYAMQVIMAFTMISMIFILLPRAGVAAKRVYEVLNTDATITDGSFSGKTDSRGKIEFKNVGFKYPDAGEEILSNISFTANPGETVAFIGATGSGKSTLINLVPRFYDVTSGEVLVDGHNVKEYTKKALRNKIGYVSQKAVIFSGSIATNISYGDNGSAAASKEDISAAADIAQAKEFIDKLPDGIDSRLAQGGTNVSGGQKQRISIARAICRKPDIFIFDDSFSALDYNTDKILRKTLEEKTKGATKLIVAQRIGTIINADKIIVLEQGEIAGIGTHKELLKSCDVYKEIAYSQLSKEELE